MNHTYYRMMKPFIVSAAVLFISSSAFAQEKISLQRAVDLALENNLQVKQARFTEATSDENLKQSKLAIAPSLNGSINQNMNWGRSVFPGTNQYVNSQNYSMSGGLSAGMTVFSGFSLMNQIRQNKLQLSADKSNIDKIKNDLVLQVVTNYLGVLNYQDLVAASIEQLKVAKETLDREQKLYDVGNKTLADISQAKSQYATAETNLTTAQNQLDIATLTLAQLMELPFGAKYEVIRPAATLGNADVEADPSIILNTALNNFPDIKLAALNTKVAEKGVDIAKGQYYPKLTIGGSLGSSYNHSSNVPGQDSFNKQINENLGQGVSMGLSVPIFNGLSAQIGVKKAKIRLQTAQVQEQLAKNNLGKVIAQAVADLKAATTKYSSAEKTYQAQKEAFNVIEQRYGVGLSNALDFSTSRSNMNKSQFDLIQAKYDLIFRRKVIDYYLGKQIVL